MPRADQAPHDLPKTIRFLRTPESRSRGLSEERSRAFQRHIDVNIHLRADVNREVTSLKTVDSSHDSRIDPLSPIYCRHILRKAGGPADSPMFSL